MTTRWASPQLGAVVAGIVVTVVALVMFGAFGAAVGMTVLPSGTGRTVIGMAATIWGGTSALLAFAMGGWMAAKVAVADRPSHGLLHGWLVGAGTLLILVALASGPLRESADFRSVAIEIGVMAEPNPSDVPSLDLPPIPGEEGAPEPAPSPRFRSATVATLLYLDVLLVMVLGAAALGGVVGSAAGRAASTSPPTPVGRDGRAVHVDPSPRVTTLLVLVTLLLSAAAAGERVLFGDVALARWIQRAPDPPAGTVAAFADGIGTVPALALAALVAAAVFAFARRPRAAAILVLAALLRALNPLLKSVFDSPRPDDELVRVTERASGSGFPSGHAMGAMLLYGGIAYLAPMLVGPRRRRIVQIPAITILLVVGFGRVYTGAHWPSDVLGGYLWGAIVLTLVAWGDRGSHRFDLRRSSGWSGTVSETTAPVRPSGTSSATDDDPAT